MFRHLSLDEMLRMHFLIGKIQGMCMMGISNRYEADTIGLVFDGIHGVTKEMATLVRIREDDSDTRTEGMDQGNAEAGWRIESTGLGTRREAEE
jgi:hypothetical protein